MKKVRLSHQPHIVVNVEDDELLDIKRSGFLAEVVEDEEEEQQAFPATPAAIPNKPKENKGR